METTIINPLKYIRQHELHKTPEQLAKDAGINLAAIGQQESGLYINPLPSYLAAIGYTPGSKDEQELIEAYHEYQTAKRIANGANNLCLLTLNPIFTLAENPLYSWRSQSGLSTYGFCSAFCIHMPTVNNFEKNITNISRIPPSGLSTPLIEAGYDLDEFNEASLLYKSHLINQSRLLNNLPPVA